MLLLNTSELIIELRQLIGNFMEPEYPTMFRSNFAVVPDLAWWKDNFFPNWRRYVENTGLRNYGQEYCELFVMEAISRALRSSGMYTEKRKQDCTISLYESRIKITGTYFNIERRNHATCLLIYNENNKPIFKFWEPQLENFELLSVPAALSHLDFRDCWL